jgi:hypothetical protein
VGTYGGAPAGRRHASSGSFTQSGLTTAEARNRVEQGLVNERWCVPYRHAVKWSR